MKRFFIIIALLALLAPGALLAQDELTLESLAEEVAALVARVEAVEGLFADPWSPDVIHKSDGICQSELHSSHQYGSRIYEHIHQTTADAYRIEYGVSIDPSDADLVSISFATEGNDVYLEYSANGGIVVEQWANCEYIGHSDWEKE